MEINELIRINNTANGRVSDFGVREDEDLSDMNYIDTITEPVYDTFDRIGWENFFHSLPKEQLEIMVCMYLGLNPLETVDVLHLKNIGKFYNVSFKLRTSYRNAKGKFID